MTHWQILSNLPSHLGNHLQQLVHITDCIRTLYASHHKYPVCLQYEQQKPTLHDTFLNWVTLTLVNSESFTRQITVHRVQ